MDGVVIGGRAVRAGAPCFVIGEAGVNHNGDLGMAHRLVDAAADAGVDAVKFQTFSADKLVTADAPLAGYQRERVEQSSQHAMLRRLELRAGDFAELAAHCAERGVLFLSTPFDEESADMLDALGMEAFKVPSGELTNLALVTHVARKGKPLLISTGMATLAEVDVAVRTATEAGNTQVVLLHCVSAYPAPPAEANLRAMDTMAAAFGLPVGYSDHTLGLPVALAACARGACVLEKHYTLDRALPGPDHAASLEPGELAEMMRTIRLVESALGSGRKEPTPSERDVMRVARRSLVAERDLVPGERLTAAAVGARRVGGGLPASLLPQLLGLRVRAAVPQGAVLALGMLE